MFESLYAGDDAVMQRPVFGEVRPVLDEIFLAQLARVITAEPKRMPNETLSKHYGLRWRVFEVVLKQMDQVEELMSFKFKQVNKRPLKFMLPEAALEKMVQLKSRIDEADAFSGPVDYPGLWHSITHNDMHAQPWSECRTLPCVRL